MASLEDDKACFKTNDRLQKGHTSKMIVSRGDDQNNPLEWIYTINITDIPFDSCVHLCEIKVNDYRPGEKDKTMKGNGHV